MVAPFRQDPYVLVQQQAYTVSNFFLTFLDGCH